MQTKKLRLAVVGFGALGQACVTAIGGDPQLTLAGIVRRRETLGEKLPKGLEHVPVKANISELGHLDAALICTPAENALAVARDVLQAGVSIVECATVHGADFQQHQAELGRLATRHKVAAVVGAGWDPGALSLFRALFGLLVTKGQTDISRRPGISLHHTTLARAVDGVRGALSTELRGASGTRQHYVYVELAHGADPGAVERAICADPQFLGEETLVFPVDSIATLEQEGHGVVLERRGSAGGVDHQLFLLEGRFDQHAMTAQVMLAGARAVPGLEHRAYTLLDLPLGSLWGELAAKAAAEYL